MKRFLTILTLISMILVAPVTCYSYHPPIPAGGIDYIEDINDESRDVYMSHKTCLDAVKRLENAMSDIGAGAGLFSALINKFTSIVIGGITLSIYVSKREIQDNDHGNGVVMRQYFFPEGSVTMSVKPQQIGH